MEEEEKLSRTAGIDGGFVSSCTVMGFIYSTIKTRKDRTKEARGLSIRLQGEMH